MIKIKNKVYNIGKFVNNNREKYDHRYDRVSFGGRDDEKENITE